MPTPARRQYLEIKAQHPDALLMYQVGDFFEFFDDDARIASRALQIVLTSRAYGPNEQVPLAGVPLHALETYAGRLVALGHKVAICEQTEPPGRGLVHRAVTRVLTPGTLAEPGLLPWPAIPILPPSPSVEVAKKAPPVSPLWMPAPVRLRARNGQPRACPTCCSRNLCALAQLRCW